MPSFVKFDLVAVKFADLTLFLRALVCAYFVKFYAIAAKAK